MATRFEGRVAHLEKSLARRKAAKVASQKVDDGVTATAVRGLLLSPALRMPRSGPLLWDALDQIAAGSFDEEPQWLVDAVACQFGRPALLQIVPCDDLVRLQRLWARHGYGPDELLEYVNAPHRLAALNRLRRLASLSEMVEPHDRAYCYWYSEFLDAESARPYIDRRRWIFGQGWESA